MNQKSYFGKSLSLLVAAVLFITAFIRGTLQVWCYAGVFSVWGIVLIIRFILPKKGVVKTKLKKLHQHNKKTVVSPDIFEIKNISNITDNIETSDDSRNNSNNPDDSNTAGLILLRHVNHRISAYLKSAYQHVTWEWVSENPERIAIEGGTGRIKLFGISDFNYADIILDQMARVECKMIKIVPLDDLQKNPGSSETVNSSAGQPDPEAWYGIQGKKILESCIGDLHSRGIANLFINENGDIYIRQLNQDIIQNKFKNFPGKNFWNGFIKVLEKNGLSASITDNSIKVSW